jgi:tRNA-uridine 2-sulfurtransferase
MKKVVVGLSGGVDSSVVAAILKQQGYHVIGVTLSLFSYTTEDTVGCCSFNDTVDATKVCDKLGIEHIVISRRKAFATNVIGQYVDGQLNGSFVNPCITCNNTVKIPTLIDFANHLGADFVATGHYAKVVDGKLVRGDDLSKDQSYFLWELGGNPSVLNRLLFPLANMTKVEVRKLAVELGLEVATKKDSTNLCFLEGGTKAEFFEKRNIGVDEGNIVNTEGKTVGTHKGLNQYTPGQRLGIASPDGKPRYVLKVIASDNTIVMGSKEDTQTNTVVVNEFKWFGESDPSSTDNLQGVCRYHQQPLNVVSVETNGNKTTVKFDKPVSGVAPGQTMVLYRNDTVIGGGILT